MIWPPRISEARDLQTYAAGIAARLDDFGRLEKLQVDPTVPSAGHAHGREPAVGLPLVMAAGFYGAACRLQMLPVREPEALAR
jgi:hypothetical protein